MTNAFKLTVSGTSGRYEWVRLPQMTTGRATHACADAWYKVGKYIYVDNRPVIECVFIKGSRPVVIVAGGMDYSHTPVSSVEFLLLSPDGDPDKARWVDMGQLQTPRAWYPAVGVLRNRLVVAGGKV